MLLVAAGSTWAQNCDGCLGRTCPPLRDGTRNPCGDCPAGGAGGVLKFGNDRAPCCANLSGDAKYNGCCVYDPHGQVASDPNNGLTFCHYHQGCRGFGASTCGCLPSDPGGGGCVQDCECGA